MSELSTAIHLNPAHMSRSPEVQAEYETHLEQNRQKRLLGEHICDMCNLGDKIERRVDIPSDIGNEFSNILDQEVGIFENEYPYRMWDFKKVAKHDLLIPLEHKASFDKLSAAARGEYVLQLEQLSEALEYDSVSIRLPTSSASSIRNHMHTHLIKEVPGVYLAKLAYDAESGRQPEVIFSDELEEAGR